MYLTRRKHKVQIPQIVIPALMTVGSFLCFFSAVDASGCEKGFSSPWNGLLQLENAFLQMLTRKTGHIYLLFSCVDNRDYRVTALLAALLLLPLYLYAVRRRAPLTALIGTVCIVFGCAVGLFRSAVGLFLLAVGCLLLLMYCAGAHNFVIRALALLLCVGVVFGAVTVSKISVPCADIHASVRRPLHRLRYEKNDPLPEGDLRRDTSAAQTVQAALRVQADTPQRMYLRGFVGTVFDGTRWTAQDLQTTAAYTELFYWLQSHGFYPETQTMDALRAADRCTAQTVRVTNISACKKYAFLPTVSSAPDLLRTSSLREGYVPAGSVCTAQTVTGDKSVLFDAQRKLSMHVADSDYMQCERAYAQYVYAAFLSVPPETQRTLDALVEDAIRTAGIADRIQYTLTWFKPYTHTRAAVRWDGDDAAAWFLQSATAGNDALFATAGAMLLRYLGIPARYAEGYLTDGKSETVRREAAHIWTEYYLDGIGWIPLETLPALTRRELSYYSETGSGVDTPHRQQTPTDPPVEPPTQTTVQADGRGLFGVAGLSVLLLPAGVLLWRRGRFCRRMRKIRAMEPRAQIPALYAYGEHICAQCGVSPPREAAYALQQEALFSDHPMTDRHVEAMRQFVQTCTDAAKRAAKPLRRLKNRIWDCLY